MIRGHFVEGFEHQAGASECTLGDNREPWMVSQQHFGESGLAVVYLMGWTKAQNSWGTCKGIKVLDKEIMCSMEMASWLKRHGKCLDMEGEGERVESSSNI